jgi:hypothetical protein
MDAHPEVGLHQRVVAVQRRHVDEEAEVDSVAADERDGLEYPPRGGALA